MGRAQTSFGRERGSTRSIGSGPAHAGTTPEFDPSRLRDALDAGLADLSLDLALDERERLLSYLSLLQRWNRVYNLTAIRDPAAMLVQHLLDSLAVLPFLRALAGGDPTLRSATATATATATAFCSGDVAQPPAQANAERTDSAMGAMPADLVHMSGPSLLDVGSGAGLPGIPLAIAWRALRVDLVEPVGKKAAFLRQCVGELGLAGRVRAHGCRVEQLAPGAFDVIVCRAFASLADFVRAIEAQVGPATRVLALKGQRPEAEIAALPHGWRVDGLQALNVPGLDAERHLVLISRSADSMRDPVCAAAAAGSSAAHLEQ